MISSIPIYNKAYAKVRRPRLLPQPLQTHDVPHVGQLQQASHDENDSKNSSSSHKLLFICSISRLNRERITKRHDFFQPQR